MSTTQIALLKKYGLEIRGLIGQHLLIDPNIQRKVVETLSPRKEDWVLEIGPGIGALTAEILANGACVIAVEKDRRFCEILEGELGQNFRGRFWVVNADILKSDLKRLLRRPPGLSRNGFKIKVVSNLPYYITSPVLFWLIANRSFVEKVVLMVQREVARRILAQPGDKDYSRLTLAIRYYAEVQKIFDVSRNSFTPKPAVDSTVITLDFYPPSKFPKGVGEDFLFHIIQTAFGARRKTLLGRLANDPKIGKSKEELLAIFSRLGIAEEVRGEDLLLKDFISLSLALR